MASLPQAAPSIASPILWDRTPRDRTQLLNLTAAEERTWHDINSAILNGTGEISVPDLARRGGVDVRTVYRRLRAIKNKGLIYSVTLPGKTSKYYLSWEYAGRGKPPVTTPTPDIRVTPTHDIRVTGHPYSFKNQRKPQNVSVSVSRLRFVCSFCGEAAGAIEGICCGCGFVRKLTGVP